jgi:hypothetical protein
MLRAFPTLRAETRDRGTLLYGAVADQAALHGVLAQVEALGLSSSNSAACLPGRRPAGITRARDACSPGRT